MAHPIEKMPSNLLLQALSPGDWRRVAPSLTRVAITLHQPLELAGTPITDVYFLEQGLASIVAETLTGHRNEVGLLGREGMTGGSIILGDTESPFDSMAQMDGIALRLSAFDLQGLIQESAPAKKILMDFARALTIQTVYTALANGQSHVDQRLARWLLMVHDRVMGDMFAITHEYLSVMLGVRRTGVTDAMRILEGKGLIASSRNKVVIKDRPGLIAFSDGSYGPSEREFKRVTGMDLAKSSWGGERTPQAVPVVAAS